MRDELCLDLLFLKLPAPEGKLKAGRQVVRWRGRMGVLYKGVNVLILESTQDLSLGPPEKRYSFLTGGIRRNLAYISL